MPVWTLLVPRGILAVWLAAPLGEQEAMIFTDPARFFRPPYVGARGWVGVRIDRRPSWTLMKTLWSRPTARWRRPS